MCLAKFNPGANGLDPRTWRQFLRNISWKGRTGERVEVSARKAAGARPGLYHETRGVRACFTYVLYSCRVT
jgi:hypothetical protein